MPPPPPLRVVLVTFALDELRFRSLQHLAELWGIGGFGIAATLPQPCMSRCGEPPANTMPTRAASTRGAGSTTDIGSGSGTATLTDSASNSVTANGVDGGTAGGTISNCASLNGDGLTVAVSSFTFTVVPAVNLQACNTLAVGAVTLPTFTTYTQGRMGCGPARRQPGHAAGQ